MSDIVEKLETALKQLDYIAKSEYIKGLDFNNIDSTINKLCDYLVDLMIAQDKYDIYESNSDEFLDDLLRGGNWVGYDRLEHSEVIEEFLGRTFCECPDDFIGTIESLILRYYWQEEAYKKDSPEVIINDTVYNFAKLVNNVVGTMEE